LEKRLLWAACGGFFSGEEWDEDKRKLGYSGWLEDKLVDALYNTQPVLDRYMKL
jgi:hypothetical protein